MRGALALALLFFNCTAHAGKPSRLAADAVYRGKAPIPMSAVDRRLACGGLVEGAHCRSNCFGNGCWIFVCLNGQIVQDGAKHCSFSMEPLCANWRQCP